MTGGRLDSRLLSFASITSLAVVALAASIIGPLAYAPQASAASDCPSYEVIGARGSGQTEKDREMRMGPEVHDFFVSLRALVGRDVVNGYGVHYPAVDVKSLSGVGAALHIGFLGKYTGSVRDGQRDTEARMRWRHRNCRDTRFILTGYSQGAQVVGDVAQRSTMRSLVAAVALFGDPYFNADSWSARGGNDPSAYGAFGPRPEWDESLRGRVFSYCHWHDIICNVSYRHYVAPGVVYIRDPFAASISAHGTPAYRLVAHGGRGDAGQAAREVATAIGFVPSPIPYAGPLDVAFVIDSTGSMSDEIEEVKEDVTALVEQIAAIDPDYRLALVDYKDVPEEESDYQARLDSDFTTDTSAFDREAEGLIAEGGGDEPESVYSGLMTALNLNWRAGAKKIVIQIGDAPAKDPEPITGYTLRSVQAKALSVDPATIDTIQSGEESEAQESFSQIAAATGGQYLQLSESEPAGLVSAITDEIRRNTAAPYAVLSIPSAAVAGRPVTLSAGASYGMGEPIAGYDWDFNGDGVFDASTTDPVATYTYPAPVSGTATVRVRSTSGLASLASAPIVVQAPVETRPGHPRHLSRRVRGSKVTLSWTAGKGAWPQWFTVFDRHGRALARIPVRGNPHRTAKGRRRHFELSIPALRPHHRYRFSVAAGDDAGESRRAGPVIVTASLHRHQRH